MSPVKNLRSQIRRVSLSQLDTTATPPPSTQPGLTMRARGGRGAAGKLGAILEWQAGSHC